MHNYLDLTGKRVLVTGASSGIGRATAIVLSSMGAEVVLTGRNEARLRETLLRMEEPSRHSIQVYDLSEIDGIAKWARGLSEESGRLFHGFVHAAGVSKYMPLRTLTKNSIDSVMIPNLYSSFGLLRAFGDKRVTADGGSLILISSIASMVGTPGLSAYSASKSALEGLCRSAARELGGRGIRVNAIVPGWVATPMFESAKAIIEEQVARDVERQFLGVIDPEEIGVLAGYLLSDASKRVTGSLVLLDGGYTC